MNKIKLINFIDLSLHEKKTILAWRNNINVRKWMHTQDIISLENHLNYIHSLKTTHNKLYFLVKEKNNLIGVIDFTSIDKINSSAEIGLYANISIKGVGNKLIESIIGYGFNTIKVNRLFATVLKTNIKAIKLYNKYGFIAFKEDNNSFYMELINENR